jgi:cytochrome c553
MFKPVVILFSASLLAGIGLQPVNLAASDSKTSYEAKCASCHAKDGTGNPKIISLLKVDISKLNLTNEEVAKKSDAQLAKTIREGIDKSKMKGYKDQFSEQEIAGLVKYIRSLKK